MLHKMWYVCSECGVTCVEDEKRGPEWRFDVGSCVPRSDVPIIHNSLTTL